MTRKVLVSLDPHESNAFTPEEAHVPAADFQKSASVIAFQNALSLVENGDELVILGVISQAYEPDASAIGASDLPAVMMVTGAKKEESREKKAARATLASYSKKAHIVFPKLEIHCFLAVGDAPETILKSARDCKPDLIVTGARKMGAFKRAIFGSVSTEVIHNSEIPVLVVKSDIDHPLTMGPRTVLCALDPHEHWATSAAELVESSPKETQKSSSAIAFENAIGLLREGDKLVIFAVISRASQQDLSSTSSEDFPVVEEALKGDDTEEKKIALLALSAYSEKAETAFPSMKIETVLAMGSAAETILKAAHKYKASCIVVGARKMGGIKRAILGSVSTEVAHNSHVPVLVCK